MERVRVRCFLIANDAVETVRREKILEPNDDHVDDDAVDSDAVAGVDGNSRSRRRRGMIRRQTIRNPADTLTSGVKGTKSNLDCSDYFVRYLMQKSNILRLLSCSIPRAAATSAQVNDDTDATGVKWMTMPDSFLRYIFSFSVCIDYLISLVDISNKRRRRRAVAIKKREFRICCFKF
jgi:hypothetical protein